MNEKQQYKDQLFNDVDSHGNKSTSPDHKIGDKNAIKLLNDMEDAITSNYKDKNKDRKSLFHFIKSYFICITIFICGFIILNKNIKLDELLIGGLFTNLLGLLLVVFKYAFSSPKEYYHFSAKLFDWLYKTHRNDK